MLDHLANHLLWQAEHCRALGSGFYGTLLEGLVEDVRRGGPVARVLADSEGDPKETALAIRLLSTVRRMVLTGDAPDLAIHYPSVGGDGDAVAVVDDFVSLVGRYSSQVRAGLLQAPQTNDVGRSAALFGALLHHEPKLPVRIFELGASAGLNLLGDQYRYLAEDRTSWGTHSSPVVLDRAWNRVPGEGQVDVIERIGTDLAPVDVTTDAGALTLASYVWPDQEARLTRLRAAIDIAREVGVDVRTGTLIDQLRTIDPLAGALTVVWHSVMWQYIDVEAREIADAELRRLIESSTETAPFVHISFEPGQPHSDQRELGQQRAFAVTSRDGNGLRHLGVGPPHGLPTRWVYCPAPSMYGRGW